MEFPKGKSPVFEVKTEPPAKRNPTAFSRLKKPRNPSNEPAPEPSKQKDSRAPKVPQNRKRKAPESSSSSDSDTTEPPSTAQKQVSAPKISDDEIHSRLLSLQTCTICAWTLFDENLLNELRVADEVRAYFSNIGWGAILDIDETVSPKLCLQFFSTFTCAKLNDEVNCTNDFTVSFYLGDRTWTMSINELNTLLGFETETSLKSNEYIDAVRNVPSKYDVHAEWSSISCEPCFKRNVSKSTSITKGALRLCHRFLAYNLFGRMDTSSVLTQTDVFLLHNMVNGTKVNFGYWLAKQFAYKTSHIQGNLPLGAFITRIAKALGVYDDGLCQDVVDMETKKFTYATLITMNLIYFDPASGHYQFYGPGAKPSRQTSDSSMEEALPPWVSHLSNQNNKLSTEIKELKELVMQQQGQQQRLLELVTTILEYAP